MSADPSRPFRLAIRDEGSFVAAYLARTEDMKGAELVATLAKTFALVPDTFDAWKRTLTGALVGALGAAGHTVAAVEEHRPPEHERAGHA